jgi:hypothetical protein
MIRQNFRELLNNKEIQIVVSYYLVPVNKAHICTHLHFDMSMWFSNMYLQNEVTVSW